MTTEEKNTEDVTVLGTGEVRAEEPAPEQKVAAERQSDEKIAEADRAAVAKDLAEKPTHRATMGNNVSPVHGDAPGLPDGFHPAGLAGSFTDRFRSKTSQTRRDEAFRTFFEMASTMNEFAHGIGIKGAHLDAESGEVTVTFSSREAAQSA